MMREFAGIPDKRYSIQTAGLLINHRGSGNDRVYLCATAIAT